MPPLIPCHVKLSCGIFLRGSWFPSEQTRENREEDKTERLSLCNPISGVTWPWTLFHVLFIRCKSLGLAYTQQEGITEGRKYLKSRVVAVCHGWANRSMELVNNLPKVTQIVSGRARIKIQVIWPPWWSSVKNPLANSLDMGLISSPERLRPLQHN